LPVCYDDDDDEERSDSLDDNIISGLPLFSAITPNEPVLSTEEPNNSPSMRDEHLDTILATESDEFIKSSVENLIPIPSESEEFSSTDDDSFSFDKIDYVEASPLDSELVGSEVMEIVTPKVGGIEASNDNPILFYDPIISRTPLNLTPSRESDFFLEDSDSLMKEIDLFCTLDYPMPSGIKDKDYDSERDILIPKDFPSNNTLSFAEKESFYFDILPFSRPPAKPPDGDTGILNIKMMGDIYDQKAFMNKLMITLASHQ
nr:hypothetical protein [Tanacetum cinerariifolium]